MFATITKIPESKLASTKRRWVLRFRDGYGQPVEMTFEKKRQAIAEAKAQGLVIDLTQRTAITFFELRKECADAYAKSQWGRSAKRRTKRLFRYLKDAVGDVLLWSIDDDVLDAIEARLKEATTPLVVRQSMGRLRLMLDEAVSFGWLASNPFNDRRPQELPDVPLWKLRERSRKRYSMPTLLQVLLLLDDRVEEGEEEISLLVVVILLTGLRINEALALEWGDVNDVDHVISIDKSLDAEADRVMDAETYGEVLDPLLIDPWAEQTSDLRTGAEEDLEEDGDEDEEEDEEDDDELDQLDDFVKTHAGLREVPMTDELEQRLQSFKKRSGGRSDARVFSYADGFANPNSAAFDRLTIFMRKRLDGVRFNFIALRHAAAALWIWQNLPEDAISTWMGHSSVPFTLDVYAYLFDSMELGATTWPTSNETDTEESAA